MPVYEYVPDDESCDDCGGRFEVLQSMSDDPLTACPKCEKPCHQVLSAFGVVGKEKAMMSNKNLEAKGFTKYVKAGDGTYEKAAGEGPNVIHRD